MATCGGLRSLFETPAMPENPTLMESLSWQNQIPKRPLDHASFTEIFGELHFQEKPPIFSWKSSDSLQLCTEGLGSESSDDVDNEYDARFKDKIDQKKPPPPQPRSITNNNCKNNGKLGFPPPISSIGRSGKPWVCLKAHREGGRFVLREIRMPTSQEVVLKASRHDGRLKLRFACPDQEDVDDGTAEEEEEEEEQHGGDDEAREEVDGGGDGEADQTPELISRA